MNPKTMLRPRPVPLSRLYVPADQLHRAVTGHGFGRAAEFLDNSVLVANDDRVDRRLEDRPIPALALPELPFDSHASAALVPEPEDEEPGYKAEHKPGSGTPQAQGVEDFGDETRHCERPDFPMSRRYRIRWLTPS